MAISQFPEQWSVLVSFVGARRIDGLSERLRASAKPRTTESLLTAGLTERCGPNQRLTGVRPTVGMGSMAVVIVQIRLQAPREVVSRCKVAALEESACQGTEPQFDLIEPRTVLGREVKYVLVFG